MKYLFIILTILTSSVKGQNGLIFDKLFVQSEDKWVAFQKDKDSSYSYGFIYIDSQAGLTYNYEGHFKINNFGTFIPLKREKIGIKARLQPNNVLVAFIPENKFSDLNIPKIPEWLGNYKTDTGSIERLYKWGYKYNGWNQCEKALKFLNQAQHLNPKFSGLSVELAFSFNCLGQYEKAITVLKYALETDSENAYINKELIYAQIKSGKLEDASKSCKKALSICKDTSYNGENCYNLLVTYFDKMDLVNFKLWIEETKKWNLSNENLSRSIKIMEDKLER